MAVNAERAGNLYSLFGDHLKRIRVNIQVNNVQPAIGQDLGLLLLEASA